MFKGPRRLGMRYWLKYVDTETIPMFVYDFNETIGGVETYLNASHGLDLPYVFHNIDGVGYDNYSTPWYGQNPFLGQPKAFWGLADSVCRMWIAFFDNQNPNHAGQIVLHWPAFTEEKKEIMIFGAARPSYIGTETYHSAGTDAMIEFALGYRKLRP
ncbi:unnamed protein product [Clonostachys rosea]|uniref:Carboxylesterase type B domain-containing protein n=1 Tax=Bionectria ochroleuca TaxID=29856 RepID=A0ABY6UKR9_BIOOC|nr:unnamed protein product [Clonostachys rosea]